jgi:hypothetical protein
LNEYAEVLIRDFKYSKEGVIVILMAILNVLKIVQPKKTIKVIKEDPDDNKILECGVESKSKIILSYEKHLLKLRKFRDIKIMTPDEFLKNN